MSSQIQDDDDFVQITELTRRKGNLDLIDFSWTGDQETDNVKLQVYGVAMSLYRARRLRHEGINPDLIAEHSMGIYAALAVAGSLTEEDALEITYRTGHCMSQMGKTGDYAFGCVVGLQHHAVLAIAENNEVYPANLNTSRHYLLSGDRRKMEAAAAEALAAKAFSVKLFPCDAPLHSPLMEHLTVEITDIFADYDYREPVVPIINHIDQSYLTAGDMAAFLVRELTLPVYWEKSYKTLKEVGVTRFLEVGAGDSLKKYNRWIDSEPAGS